MAIGDPITMTLRLAKIATGQKHKKGDVVGVATRLTFEADTVGEEQLEQLTRLQHDQDAVSCRHTRCRSPGSCGPPDALRPPTESVASPSSPDGGRPLSAR
jgi:hypothetical protein